MRRSRRPRATFRALAALALVPLAACSVLDQTADAIDAAEAAAAQEEANEAVVRTMIEAINARDLGALDAVVAPNIVRHSPATPGLVIEDLAGFKAFLEADLASVPDSRQEVIHLMADGDMVAVWATYSGTQQGPMGPFPATGKPLSTEFAGFLRLEDGLVAEMWVVWDNLAIFGQLGFLPDLPAPGG